MPILRLIGDDWPKESKINFSYDPNKAVKDYRANLMKLLSLRNIRDYTFWHVAADGESPDLERDPLNLDWKWSDHGFQPNMSVYLRKSQPDDRKCDPNAKPPPKDAPISSSAEVGAHSVPASDSPSSSPSPPPTSGKLTVEAVATVPASAAGGTTSTVIHLIGDKWIKEQRKVLALKTHETIDRYIPTISKKLEIDISVEGMRERAVGNWEMWPTIGPAGIRPDLEKGPFDPSSTWEASGVGHKSCVYFRQRKQEDANSFDAAAVAVPPALPTKVEETKADTKNLIANKKEDTHGKSTANVQLLPAPSAPMNSTIVSTVVSNPNPTEHASSPSTLTVVETPIVTGNSESIRKVTNPSDTQQTVGADTKLINPLPPSSSTPEHLGGNGFLTSETKVAPQYQINLDQQTAMAAGATLGGTSHILEISSSAPLLAEQPLPPHPRTSNESAAQSQLQGGLLPPAQNNFSTDRVPRTPFTAYNTSRLDDAAEAEKQALREHILKLEARVVRMEAAERVRAEREAAIAAELGYPAVGSWRHLNPAAGLSSDTLSKANSSGQRMIGEGIDNNSPLPTAKGSDFRWPETGLAHAPSPTRASVPFVEDERLRKDLEAQLEDLDLSTQRRRRHASTAIALYEMSRFRGARGHAADLPAGSTSHTYSYMY